MNTIPWTMILTYGALLAFILVGGKVAKKGTFNEDFLSYDVMQSLKGFAAIGIILHHISQNPAVEASGELAFFSPIGFIFTGIFFICSGYGLIFSLNTKKDYLKTFLKKRVLPIFVAYITMNLIYCLWKSFTNAKMTLVQTILSVLGLVLANDQGWYVVVILLLYLAFYFTFKHEKNRKISFLIMFLVIVFQIAAFMVVRHFAWWAGPKNWWLEPGALEKAAWWKKGMVMWFSGEWWVNSTLMFFVGLLLAQYKTQIVDFFKKHYWIKFSILLVVAIFSTGLGLYCLGKIGYWREWIGDNSVLPRLITFLAQTLQIVTTISFVFVLMMKYRFVNKVAQFFGSITLEFYVMQRIAINTFAFILPNGKATNFLLPISRVQVLAYTVTVFVATLIFALLFKYINKKDVEALTKSRAKS